MVAAYVSRARPPDPSKQTRYCPGARIGEARLARGERPYCTAVAFCPNAYLIRFLRGNFMARHRSISCQGRLSPPDSRTHMLAPRAVSSSEGRRIAICDHSALLIFSQGLPAYERVLRVPGP